MSLLTPYLAKLRAMEEGFMGSEADFCFLLPESSVNAIGDASKSGYTATITRAQLWEDKRIPKGGDVDQVQKIAPWKVSVPHATVVSVKMIGLQGVKSWKGPYDAGTAYAVGDGVNVAQKFYKSIQAGTNHPVSDAAYWAIAPTFQVMGTNDAETDRASLIADLKLIAS